MEREVLTISSKISSEFLATLILILTYLLKEAYTYLKVKPKRKGEFDLLSIKVSSIHDHQMRNEKTLVNIEKFTQVLANQYITTFPLHTIEKVVNVMFANSRHQIYTTILDWLRETEIKNVRLLEQRKEQVTKMICNVYQNDYEFLVNFKHNDEIVSIYMDEKWIDMVTSTALSFIDSHLETGNHFAELKRNLKNDFELIENNFLQKLRE